MNNDLSKDILSFLDVKCKEGKISSEQMISIISCVDSGASTQEILDTLNLYKDYLAFSDQDTKNKQIDQFQIKMLTDRLLIITTELTKLVLNIRGLEEPLKKPRSVLNHWKDRLKMYPENKRFQKEVEDRQKELAPMETEINKVYGRIEDLEKEKLGINKSLNELI